MIAVPVPIHNNRIGAAGKTLRTHVTGASNHTAQFRSRP